MVKSYHRPSVLDMGWQLALKLLDYILGKEIGAHYDRERLKELVKVSDR